MSGTRYTANIPVPTDPIVDADTGIVTQAWWRYFLTLYDRTGGSQGTSSSNAILVAEQALTAAEAAQTTADAASSLAKLDLMEDTAQPQRPNPVLMALAFEG